LDEKHVRATFPFRFKKASTILIFDPAELLFNLPMHAFRDRSEIQLVGATGVTIPLLGYK